MLWARLNTNKTIKQAIAKDDTKDETIGETLYDTVEETKGTTIDKITEKTIYRRYLRLL